MEHLAELLYKLSEKTNTPLRIEKGELDIHRFLLEASKENSHAASLFLKLQLLWNEEGHCGNIDFS
ncbi:hypothetical protein [Bacillus infantis]|uniref:hypothetical protein n=1 Tax=Bacillus infantis TaxID=324767 RepID=UPI00321C2938